MIFYKYPLLTLENNILSVLSLKNRRKINYFEIEDLDTFIPFIKSLPHNEIKTDKEKEYLQDLVDAGLIDFENNTSENKKIRALQHFLKYRSSIKVDFSQENIAIIGVGTIGSSLITKLLEIGCNNIDLFDFDNVEEGNIGFQNLYQREDIGKSKVESLKYRAEQLFPKANIQAFHQRITKNNNYSVIFLCADELDRSDIDTITNYLEQGTWVVKAGYGVYQAAVKIYKNTVSFSNDVNKQQEKRSQKLFSENIGTSVEGDVSASFMLRLWLAHTYLDYKGEEVIIDTFLEDGVLSKRAKPFTLDEIKHNDSIQQSYINYIRTGDQKYWEQVLELDKECSFVEQEDADEYYTNYYNALQNSFIETEKGKIALSDIVRERTVSPLSDDIEQKIKSESEKLIPLAIDLIKHREIKDEFSEFEHNKIESVIALVHKQWLPKTIDFSKYTIRSLKTFGFETAVNLIKDSYKDQGFQLHNIKIEKGIQNIAIYRYLTGETYCFADYQNSAIDILPLAQEIGHGFHNSFIKDKLHYNTEELFMEVGGQLSELKIITYLTKINQDLSNYLFNLKIIDQFISKYSLNEFRLVLQQECYEQNPNLIKAREQLLQVQEQRNNVIFKKKDKSNYNFIINIDFLDGESNSLYLKSLVYAAAILYCDLEEDYINYMLQEEYQCTLSRFLNYVDLSKEEFWNMGLEYLSQQIINSKFVFDIKGD